LLAQSVSLALLRLHLLPHTFALSLLPGNGLWCTLLLDLLPAQILHLLASVAITTSRLSGQIGHLSFPRLLCCYVRLRTRLRTIARLRDVVRSLLVCRSALICDLKFLVPCSIGHGLDV
jgi:hypothetical protein